MAIFFNETMAPWCLDRPQERRPLMMFTVNLAECLILLRDRQPRLFAQMKARLLDTGMRFIPPTLHHAEVAAEARMRFPLNLGVCFAYALAQSESVPLLTLDRDFRRTDIEVILPPRK